MRKDQYVIKNYFRQPLTLNKITKSVSIIPLDDNTHTFDENGYPIPEGVSLMNPKVCEAILCNYSRLKAESEGKFDADTWYMMYAFEQLCDIALKDYPLYMRLVECKIDGMQNIDIQA
jgi:hypothetical protein